LLPLKLLTINHVTDIAGSIKITQGLFPRQNTTQPITPQLFTKFTGDLTLFMEEIYDAKA
jgi:hypothetical protein